MAAPRITDAKAMRVSHETVVKAVRALVKWMKAQREGKAGKQQLLSEELDDEFVYVQIGLSAAPQLVKTNGFRIPLPHSLYPLGGGKEVCLIVKDIKENGHKDAKAKLQKQGGAGVTKVLGLSKLRSKYRQNEMKRQLLGSFDLFLADDRILSDLPRALGVKIFKKKKHPIPVCLSKGDWVTSIRAACDATYFYFGGGPSMCVRAARFSMSEEEIVENVLAVVEGAVARVPKRWRSVSSLHVRANNSLSLPIFVASPDPPAKIEV